MPAPYRSRSFKTTRERIALPWARETGQNAVMSEITIRPGRPGDAHGIARLDIETWRATYAGMLSTAYLVGLSERRREAGWRGVILREPRDVRIAVGSNGAILGFGSCGPNRGDRSFTGEVFTLYVAPDWQNQGQDLAFDGLGGQRTDVAKTDVAGAVHDISLRHTVNPKIDRRHAVAVDPDMAEGVAEAVQKPARLFGLVLIRDAVERDPGE